jgi:drug/metabolite transporter, DME family
MLKPDERCAHEYTQARMKQEHYAIAAASLTAALWGLTGIFVRLLPPIAPVAVTAGRLMIALAVALPLLAFWEGGRQALRGALGHPPAYLLALLLAGYYLLATAAFQMAPVAEVALLLSTPPLFVLAYRRLRGERPAGNELAGALLAVAGMGVILAPNLSLTDATDAIGQARLLGDGLAICAAALTAGYALLFRSLAERASAPSALGVTFLTFLLGSAALAGPALASGVFAGMTADASQIGLLLGLGVLCTAIPSLGFAFASRRLPAVASASIALFIPLFAALFAHFFLDEAMSPTLLPGGALVLGGLAWMLRKP